MLKESSNPITEPIDKILDTLYRAESRRVLATLIRLLGDFDLAEEALHDAFRAALEQWPRDGIPANPRAWLVSAGRFKAIDTLRRRARFEAAMPELAERIDSTTSDPALQEGEELADDRLRLIFTCGHARWPVSRSSSDQYHYDRRQSGGISSCPCGAGRFVSAAGANGRGPHRLCTGPHLHAARARTALS